ncbi:MAG: AAA family ATPase [Gemmataceae bacterium]
MIPKRIELENFLSFGKPAVEFMFTDDEPLWALCGRNGVGKSAVFDGITYALYGEHRGGTQKAEQLIRHGANGFRIVFEFEFASVEYRITRVRAGRTSQKVERRLDGEWEAVPGVNSAPDVKKWVEETLGLEYKAFTTSVLLRQGEADKLFSASRDERIAVLKGIIGFKRFEEVSGRVHAATLCRGNTLDTLRRQLSALLPVTPEELEAAENAVTAAEQKHQEAQTALTDAVQRVEQAKQWEGLEKKRASLEQQLAAAEKRAVEAPIIRAAKVRLDDLTAVVPELEALVKVRRRIAGLNEKLHAARLTLGTKELAQDINQNFKLLNAVVVVENLEGSLQQYSPELDTQIEDALVTERKAEEDSIKAAAVKTRAETMLEQAVAQHEQFSDVAVGTTCSRCGQLVSAEHAETERIRLTEQVSHWQTAFNAAKVNAETASNRFATARRHRQNLEALRKDRDALRIRLEAQRDNLSTLGEVASSTELRARLTSLLKQWAQREGHPDRDVGLLNPLPDEKRLDVQKKIIEGELKAAKHEVETLDKQLATAHGEEHTILKRLTDPWKEQLPNLDAERIAELTAERNRLQQSSVADKFDLLRQDEEKRAERKEQLQAVISEIDRIPDDARIPAKEAEHRQRDATAQLDIANGARDVAVRTRDGLQSRTEEYQRLTAQLREAEREHDLHKKLDDLLGQNGLQRELVRDAEQQIVELANDTLQNLSDGELSLEQDDEAAGRDDKAFALRVRRAGDPLPIGVLFLSGSQKFRVAVSVALAVGRFASGRARPLEAVIIDEGFGSLDKDGLRAMADELKRLQRSQSLKRVILVSHQDEFTDQFPVGYRLSPGENGTMAAPFRR